MAPLEGQAGLEGISATLRANFLRESGHFHFSAAHLGENGDFGSICHNGGMGECELCPSAAHPWCAPHPQPFSATMRANDVPLVLFEPLDTHLGAAWGPHEGHLCP